MIKGLRRPRLLHDAATWLQHTQGGLQFFPPLLPRPPAAPNTSSSISRSSRNSNNNLISSTSSNIVSSSRRRRTSCLICGESSVRLLRDVSRWDIVCLTGSKGRADNSSFGSVPWRRSITCSLAIHGVRTFQSSACISKTYLVTHGVYAFHMGACISTTALVPCCKRTIQSRPCINTAPLIRGVRTPQSSASVSTATLYCNARQLQRATGRTNDGRDAAHSRGKGGVGATLRFVYNSIRDRWCVIQKPAGWSLHAHPLRPSVAAVLQPLLDAAVAARSCRLVAGGKGREEGSKREGGLGEDAAAGLAMVVRKSQHAQQKVDHRGRPLLPQGLLQEMEIEAAAQDEVRCIYFPFQLDADAQGLVLVATDKQMNAVICRLLNACPPHITREFRVLSDVTSLLLPSRIRCSSSSTGSAGLRSTLRSNREEKKEVTQEEETEKERMMMSSCCGDLDESIINSSTSTDGDCEKSSCCSSNEGRVKSSLTLSSSSCCKRTISKEDGGSVESNCLTRRKKKRRKKESNAVPLLALPYFVSATHWGWSPVQRLRLAAAEQQEQQRGGCLARRQTAARSSGAAAKEDRGERNIIRNVAWHINESPPSSSEERLSISSYDSIAPSLIHYTGEGRLGGREWSSDNEKSSDRESNSASKLRSNKDCNSRRHSDRNGFGNGLEDYTATRKYNSSTPDPVCRRTVLAKAIAEKEQLPPLDASERCTHKYDYSALETVKRQGKTFCETAENQQSTLMKGNADEDCTTLRATAALIRRGWIAEEKRVYSDFALLLKKCLRLNHGDGKSLLLAGKLVSSISQRHIMLRPAAAAVNSFLLEASCSRLPSSPPPPRYGNCKQHATLSSRTCGHVRCDKAPAEEDYGVKEAGIRKKAEFISPLAFPFFGEESLSRRALLQLLNGSFLTGRLLSAYFCRNLLGYSSCRESIPATTRFLRSRFSSVRFAGWGGQYTLKAAARRGQEALSAKDSIHTERAAVQCEGERLLACTNFALLSLCRRRLANGEVRTLGLYRVSLQDARQKTHQIRVHFSEAGAPLANDSLYNPHFSRDTFIRDRIDPSAVESFANTVPLRPAEPRSAAVANVLLNCSSHGAEENAVLQSQSSVCKSESKSPQAVGSKNTAVGSYFAKPDNVPDNVEGAAPCVNEVAAAAHDQLPCSRGLRQSGTDHSCFVRPRFWPIKSEALCQTDSEVFLTPASGSDFTARETVLSPHNWMPAFSISSPVISGGTGRENKGGKGAASPCCEALPAFNVDADDSWWARSRRPEVPGVISPVLLGKTLRALKKSKEDGFFGGPPIRPKSDAAKGTTNWDDLPAEAIKGCAAGHGHLVSAMKPHCVSVERSKAQSRSANQVHETSRVKITEEEGGEKKKAAGLAGWESKHAELGNSSVCVCHTLGLQLFRLVMPDPLQLHAATELVFELGWPPEWGGNLD